MSLTKEGGGCLYVSAVEEIPKNCECQKCYMIMREPHIVSCCGKKYCKICIEEIKKDNKPCPGCNQTFTSMVERELERKILGLKVYCEKKEDGCEWIGELKQLEDHLDNKCLYVTVKCSLDCGEVMKRADVNIHRYDRCRKRSVQDQLHGIKSKLEARLEVLEDTCNKQHEDIKKQSDVITKQEEQLAKQQESMEKMEKIVEEQRDFIMSLQDVCRKQQEEMSKQAEEFHQALKHQEQDLHNVHSNKIAPRFSVCLNALHEYWYSPPFYSHPGGYKLCLRVKTSIPHFAAYYNVSCEASVLPGECDGNLQWPVDINIMVELFCHQTRETTTNIYEIIQAERPGASNDAAKSGKQDLLKHIRHSRPAVKLDRPHYVLYSADMAVMGVETKTYPIEQK